MEMTTDSHFKLDYIHKNGVLYEFNPSPKGDITD
jgi:hypothetical protein